MSVTPIHPAPISTLIMEDGAPGQKTVKISPPGEQWFTKAYQILRGPAISAAPPPTSSSQGNTGAIAFDQNFLYVCIRGTTPTQAAIWKRVPLIAF